MRKLIEFDDETFYALTQLGRDRVATIQDLADEAFRDLLKKHGVPSSLRDALKRSAKHEQDKKERDAPRGVARKQATAPKPEPQRAAKSKKSRRKTPEGQREMLFPIAGNASRHHGASRKSK